jgi:hypothetical protein
MAVAGMVMDVDNAKKQAASSPKRSPNKHKLKKDGTQQDVEMKDAKEPCTRLRVSLEDKLNFSSSANKNKLMTWARKGLLDSNFEDMRAMLHGAG